ncbi:MAG: sporulation integral membrane protein YtvI [Lachnospiraceae bacterium]|nr:sporulation integral membrane protein YtvI [Lachnospiraceae bacterium]
MSTKQKRAVFLLGVTAAVYLGIKYLLPLVLPFLFAYGLARLVWPFVRWSNRRLGISEQLGAVLGFFLYGVGAVLVFGSVFLLAGRQLTRLLEQLPDYLAAVEQWLVTWSRQISMWSGIRTETVTQYINEGILAMQEMVTNHAARELVPLIRSLGNLFAVISVVLISAFFYIRERQLIRDWMERSIYRREIRMITKRLGSLARAFFKSQSIIFGMVTMVCSIGLLVLGNRYYLILGILIGMVDILPIFGTGTILIPWAAVCLLTGSFSQAAGLVVIYVLTYFLRELLEARMMGKQMGIGSLEMMAAMYAGLKLFGIWGLFLGPIGWILIKEIDKTLYLEYNNR